MRPTIKSRHEYRDNREHEHPVKTGAHAAKDDLAELHQPERDEPTERA